MTNRDLPNNFYGMAAGDAQQSVIDELQRRIMSDPEGALKMLDQAPLQDDPRIQKARALIGRIVQARNEQSATQGDSTFRLADSQSGQYEDPAERPGLDAPPFPSLSSAVPSNQIAGGTFDQRERTPVEHALGREMDPFTAIGLSLLSAGQGMLKQPLSVLDMQRTGVAAQGRQEDRLHRQAIQDLAERKEAREVRESERKKAGEILKFASDYTNEISHALNMEDGPEKLQTLGQLFKGMVEYTGNPDKAAAYHRNAIQKNRAVKGLIAGIKKGGYGKEIEGLPYSEQVKFLAGIAADDKKLAVIDAVIDKKPPEEIERLRNIAGGFEHPATAEPKAGSLGERKLKSEIDTIEGKEGREKSIHPFELSAKTQAAYEAQLTNRIKEHTARKEGAEADMKSFEYGVLDKKLRGEKLLPVEEEMYQVLSKRPEFQDQKLQYMALASQIQDAASLGKFIKELLLLDDSAKAKFGNFNELITHLLAMQAKAMQMDMQIGETWLGKKRVEGVTPTPERQERLNPRAPALKQKKEWSIRPIP